MTLLLQEFRKNSFQLIIPIVLLFSFSLSYLFQSIILLLFEPGNLSKSKQEPLKKIIKKDEIFRSISTYEELATGNFIRSSDAPLIEENNSTNPTRTGIAEQRSEFDDDIVTGTLSGHWSFARVTIQSKKDKNSLEYATGEKIGPYQIKSIRTNSILLSMGGANSFKVEIGQSISDAKKSLNLGTQETMGPASESKEISQGSSVKKVLSRQDINEKLNDPAALYKGARFGPNLKNGKIDGYKIYQVNNDHIFYSLGARNKDIIKRVNGTPLVETEKMLEVWNQVKKADKVTVDVERDNKVITYEFIIRN